MRSVHRAVVVTLVCLFIPLDSGLFAQQGMWRSFVASWSYDSYFGIMYDSYHGYAMGARVALPFFRIPTLNRLVSLPGEHYDPLFLIPGVKLGLIQTEGIPVKSGTMYFAPELSLHYSFLRASGFSFYTGPAFELIYTNNSKKYVAIPSAGIDLGAALELSSNFSIILEHRWIVEERKRKLVNIPEFPQQPFSHLGLIVRFSLPWKAESGAENAGKSIERSRDALALEKDREIRAIRMRADSLQALAAALRDTIEETAVEKRAHAPAGVTQPIDRYQSGITTAEAEYSFTKDPFRAGVLSDDRYLKNVLIDIIDEEYVWQLSASARRKSDAEKIRSFFVLYNPTLSRRIVVGEDEHVRFFKLRCLGKVSAPGKEKGR